MYQLEREKNKLNILVSVLPHIDPKVIKQSEKIDKYIVAVMRNTMGGK